MNFEDLKGDAIRILGKQTIKKVRRECRELCENKDLPSLEEFLETESDFILTEKRENIFREIVEGLNQKESPAVVLYGSYGSGKTIIMETIATLCESGQTLEGKEFPQIKFGEKEIDCIKVSLEEKDTPAELLKAIYSGLLSSSDISEDEFIEIFNSNKDSLTLSDISNNLSKKHVEVLKEKFDDPSSLSDIAEVVKSLTSGDIHSTIVWFTNHYQEKEGNYPAFYIDEFEQLYRQGVTAQSPIKIKGIVKKLLRKATSGFEDLMNPPYILFTNILPLYQLRGGEFAERDLIKRIEESLNFSIDLSPNETKLLFSKLYRMYILPILRDNEDSASEWHDRLKESDKPNMEDYTFPYTPEVLQFVLDLIHKREEEVGGETVIAAFRDYKLVLVELLRKWEGEGDIDREFLYKYGDRIRPKLKEETETVHLDDFPGKESVDKKIEDDFSDENESYKRILKEIARKSILGRKRTPAIFSKDEVSGMAEKVEIKSFPESEINELIEKAIEFEYFEKDENRLLLNQDEILRGVGERPKPLSEEIEETVQEYDLRSRNLLELWKKGLEEIVPGMDVSQENRYLEFDVKGEIEYTNKIFLCIESMPSALSNEVEDKGLNLVFCMERNEDSEDKPAEFNCLERNDRATTIVERIQRALNSDIESIAENDRCEKLIENIKDAFTSISNYQAYKIFLKLSLLKLIENDLPEKITFLTSDETFFDVTNHVRENIRGNDRKYVAEKFGFNNYYQGNEYLDFIYAIKKAKKEDSNLIYKNQSDPYLSDVVEFGKATRNDRTKEEFEGLLGEKFSQENFIKDKDIIDSFHPDTKEVIDEIQDLLEEGEEVDFDAIIETLFGTQSIRNISKAALYFLLSIGDYLSEVNWILKDGGGEIKIVSPGSEEERVRKNVKQELREAIEKKILDQIQKRDNETGDIDRLKERYNQLGEMDLEELKETRKAVDESLTVSYGKVEDSLKNFQASPILTDMGVAEYSRDIRSIFDQEEQLIYLVLPSLENLVEEIQKAEDILQKYQNLEDMQKKIDSLGGDVSLEDIYIDILDTIKDFQESRDLGSKIESSNVKENIGKYLDDEISLDRLMKILETNKNNLIPEIEKYDPSTQKNLLEQEKERLSESLEELKSEKIDEIKKKLKWLEECKDRILEDEKGWIENGRNALENCQEELKKDVDEFDSKTFGDRWQAWKNYKGKIREGLISGQEEEINEILEDYGIDVEIDEIKESEDVNLEEIVTELEQGEFLNLFETLKDVDSKKIDRIRLYLLNRRILSQLGD